MTPFARRAALLCCATALAGTLAACASSAPATDGAAPPATPAARPATSAPAPAPSPSDYFAAGQAYAVWIFKINPGGTLDIGVVHHLTGQTAIDYLTSHGQTIPPDGLPNDYINVDTHVHRTVTFAASATVTTNDGSGPKPMSASAFLAWLPKNLAIPIPTDQQDSFEGAPTYYGPLYSVTFAHDVIVSVDQIFEP